MIWEAKEEEEVAVVRRGGGGGLSAASCNRFLFSFFACVNCQRKNLEVAKVQTGRLSVYLCDLRAEEEQP